MYRIYNNINKRRRNRYIIITHMRNFYEKGTSISTDVLFGGTYRFTWQKWQNYFYKEIKRGELPCHYFIEYLDKDYVINVGLPRVNRSYFIQDLIYCGVIDHKYSDAIVIGIGEDFFTERMEDRLMIHLCDKLLSSLMSEYGIKQENVKYIDDILNNNWKESLDFFQIRYELVPAKYFNMNDLLLKMRIYDKRPTIMMK